MWDLLHNTSVLMPRGSDKNSPRLIVAEWRLVFGLCTRLASALDLLLAAPGSHLWPSYLCNFDKNMSRKGARSALLTALGPVIE